MKTLAVEIFVSLLMMSSVLSKILLVENRTETNDSTLGTVNCTKGDCTNDITGNRRCALYILNDPHQVCYVRFFARRQPAVGLRTGNANLRNARYICQPPSICGQAIPNDNFYATMFDEQRGIVVFSAYILTQATVHFTNRARPEWYPTPGIVKQGRQAIYRNQQQYQKGHLVPSMTFSSSQECYDSTYSYTNCVPLCPAFNGGQWSQFERLIRRYAKDQCTQPLPGQLDGHGRLHLITGTSFVRIQQQPNQPVQANIVGVGTLPYPNNPDLSIEIPNSLWTAGCCVRGNDVWSFAVIGNNAQDADERLTVQVTVAYLQVILADDVTQRNMGGPDVILFPGNVACADPNSNINLRN